MSIAIKAENISKVYRLGEIGTGTLTHDLQRWWAGIRGKEDPFIKLGEENDRSQMSRSNIVWSLKDINFEIPQGNAVGIIGKNGAGKSTLLKILSKVTSSTTGSVKCRGRIASLLEVGTGFHPELTGRENIFLNGAILGMRKKEIIKKFDEIVDFSGVEKYIDTPVKRYSSGMYVRLAFAVAAHLESEILIVDEVLAVGDADFQKKCLGKMKDVSTGGRTVLFVSHNMIAVKSLCNYGIFLKNGKVEAEGGIEEIVNRYIASGVLSSISHPVNLNGYDFVVNSVEASNNGMNGYFDIDKPLKFQVHATAKRDFGQLNVNIFFNAPEGGLIFATCSEAAPVEKGEFIFECTVPANTLNDNIYSIELMAVENGSVSAQHITEVLLVQGVEPKRDGSWLGKFPGLIRPTYFSWTKTKL